MRLIFILGVVTALGGAASAASVGPVGKPPVAGLNSALWSLYQETPTGASLRTANIIGLDVATGTTRHRFRQRDDGLLLDVVVDKVSDELLASITRAGVGVVRDYPELRRLTLVVDDPQSLLRLARLPGVRSVQPAYGPVKRVGTVTSRADRALRSEVARSSFSVDGTGTLIGILSDSFAQTPGVRDGDTAPPVNFPGFLTGSRPQDSGDLPASIQILSDSVIDGSDEGAAMGELITDIAPGTSLAFHDSGESEAAMATGIDALCALGGMSAVVDDIGFFAEAYYQDDVISQAASACVAAGIPYFSAAGNDANWGFRQRFRDSDPADEQPAGLPTGIDFHDWNSAGGVDGFLGVTLSPGASVFAVLQWNQPNDSISTGNGAQIDLDLYVSTSEDVDDIFDANGASFQGTTGAPANDALEITLLSNPTGANRTLYLAVDHYAGNKDFIPQDGTTPVEFRLTLLSNGSGVVSTEYAPDGPTIYGHPAGDGVIGVAAVPWWEAAAFDPSIPPTSSTDPEPFTSTGGDISIQFDSMGNVINVVRQAPVLSSIDANNTTFFGINGATPTIDGEDDGFPNFFGTSAAAPNAAAVALLMLEREPTLTPAQIQAILEATAIDIISPPAKAGTDAITGVGLINAEDAVGQVVPPEPDTTPNAFSFREATGVGLSQPVISPAVSITGINQPADVTVSNGEYSIGCDGTFATDPGSIRNGQAVCLRHTSAADFGQSVETTLTVGGVNGVFRSTTGVADTTPEAFSFDTQLGVLPDTLVTSNIVTISGINAPSPVSVTGGEYSKGCQPDTFTSGDGEVSAGERLCLRHRSAAAAGELVTSTLTVGGVPANFTTRTQQASVDSGDDDTPIGGSGGIGSASRSGSGCVAGNASTRDPMLVLLLILSCLVILRRRLSALTRQQ